MTNAQNMTWKRDRPGRQVTTDGAFAVESDGYTKTGTGFTDATGEWIKCGDGGEWAAIDMTRPDENMDWFSTMADAKAFCQSVAARRAAVAS